MLNLAIIRLENGTFEMIKTLKDFKFISKRYRTGTELNDSIIKSVTVLPYTKSLYLKLKGER